MLETVHKSLKSNNLSLFILFKRVLLGLLLWCLQIPDTFAGQAPYDHIVEQNKWYWHPFIDDFAPTLPALPSSQSPEISLDYCWTCGIWLEEALSPAQKSTTDQRPLLFQKAQCLQALGMENEAIKVYRRIIKRKPQGDLLSRSLHSIFDILFQQENHEAVINLYHELRSAYRQQLLPESIYLISQSLFSLEKDKTAQKLLEQIPRKADIYSYALYMQAQIAFRKGDVALVLKTLTKIIDAPTNDITPKILKEMSWLMRARVLFQEKSYHKAMQDFRKLDRSNYFLTEALMGMGWCFAAQGEHSKAIAYFQNVNKTATDADTLSKAQLEIAHSYSEAQSHQDAFLIFRNLLNHLNLRISQYKKYSQDPDWLNWLAKKMLSEPSNSDFSLDQAPIMSQDRELQKEIVFYINKEQYISPRMKTVFEIQKGLKEANTLFEKPERIESAIKNRSFPFKYPPLKNALAFINDYFLPFQYPPLKTALALLPSDLRHLLDTYFALLDTEYRLISSASLLNLLTPAEKPDLLFDCLNFYQMAFQSLLFSEQDRKNAYTTLNQMQSTIRNLPGLPEERETIVTKIIFTKRIFNESEQTLHHWTEEMNSFCSSPNQPARMLLLSKWMTFVRILVDLRTWNIRSQAIFLSKSTPLPQKAISPTPLPEEICSKMIERIELIKDRLALILQREIQIMHQDRISLFENLLTKSQYYYADALIRQQKNLLQTQQKTPRSSIEQEEQP